MLRGAGTGISTTANQNLWIYNAVLLPDDVKEDVTPAFLPNQPIVGYELDVISLVQHRADQTIFSVIELTDNRPAANVVINNQALSSYLATIAGSNPELLIAVISL